MQNNTSCPRFVESIRFRFIHGYSQQIGMWTKIFSTIFEACFVACLFTGCANLGSLMRPEVDPQLVATDGTLKGAPFDIQSFLSYVKANPHIVGMDTRQSAKGLTERYESNLLNLKNTRKLYAGNRTDENLSLLKRARESVDRDRGEAVSQLNGNALPERGQGAPYAPPLRGDMPPPPAQQTIVVNQQDQIVKKLEELQRTIAQIGHMVYTNQQARLTNGVAATATNAPAKEPAIPGK